VGSHVVELLVEEGAKVKVIDNLENGDLTNLAQVKDEVEFVIGDLRNFDVCKDACRGMDIKFQPKANFQSCREGLISSPPAGGFLPGAA